MLKSKSFFKTNRKGNVIKVVREHYLRDDITCGVSGCLLCKAAVPNDEEDNPQANRLPAESPHYLILDTNVVLHQVDLITNPAMKNMIMLQTVLEEVKHQSMMIYKRVREVIQDESRHIYVFSNELMRYYKIKNKFTNNKNILKNIYVLIHHRDTYIDRLPGESPNDRNDRGIISYLTLRV